MQDHIAIFNQPGRPFTPQDIERMFKNPDSPLAKEYEAALAILAEINLLISEIKATRAAEAARDEEIEAFSLKTMNEIQKEKEERLIALEEEYEARYKAKQAEIINRFELSYPEVVGKLVDLADQLAQWEAVDYHLKQTEHEHAAVKTDWQTIQTDFTNESFEKLRTQHVKLNDGREVSLNLQEEDQKTIKKECNTHVTAIEALQVNSDKLQIFERTAEAKLTAIGKNINDCTLEEKIAAKQAAAEDLNIHNQALNFMMIRYLPKLVKIMENTIGDDFKQIDWGNKRGAVRNLQDMIFTPDKIDQLRNKITNLNNRDIEATLSLENIQQEWKKNRQATNDILNAVYLTIEKNPKAKAYVNKMLDRTVDTGFQPKISPGS